MEVVPLPVSGASGPGAGGSSGSGGHDGPDSGSTALKLPFQRHNVEEWSRLDRLTGMLEHARVETNHWSANTSNASHNYGKVVDQRARNLADGSLQQRQRKQMEVFESHVPGGSLQVIRTQSVTTSSSTSSLWHGLSQINGSRWNSRSTGVLGSTSMSESSGVTSTPVITDITADFENLQLALNPLDLSSQKTKASVGRSGSIGGRRPPSRPRSLIGRVGGARAISEEVADAPGNLSDVSRICQKIRDETKKTLFELTADDFFNSTKSFADDLEVEVSAPRIEFPPSDDDKTSRSSSSGGMKSSSLLTTGVPSKHSVLRRKKSCSSEDLTKIDKESTSNDTGGEDSLGNWNRGSKVRRSLQYSSTNKIPRDFPLGTSVSKIRQEIESRKAVGSTPFKNSKPAEVNALEGVLKRVMGKGSIFENNFSQSVLQNNERETETNKQLTLESVKRLAEKDLESKGLGNSSKRHSFVTVESLKEVRGRLRHQSTDQEDSEQTPTISETKRTNEEPDDGIVTEDHVVRPVIETPARSESPTPSRVKSYVYGMESLLNNSQASAKKAIIGTGSLESRTSNKVSSANGAKSEEWYSRRKSYGFEQVHTQHHEEGGHLKSKVESSTDSGICRSSETLCLPTWGKVANGLKSPRDTSELASVTSTKARRPLSFNECMPKTITSYLQESEQDEKESTHFPLKSSYTNDGNITKGQKTIVQLGSFNSDSDDVKKSDLARRRELLTKNAERDSLKQRMSVEKFPASNGWHGLTSRNSIGFLNQKAQSRRLSEPVTITIPIVANDACTVRPNELKRGLLKPVTEPASPKGINPWTTNGYAEAGKVKEWPHHFTWSSKDDRLDSNDATREIKSPQSDMKRHSIAVDEFKYVQDDVKDIENEIPGKGEPVRRLLPPNVLQSRNNVKSMDIGTNFMTYDYDDPNNTNLSDSQDESALSRKKRVEFCKTEVHFAAEPGRFNLVSTDDKPPPTQIVRGRRRNKLQLLAEQRLNKSGLPEVRFGDSLYEKKLLAHEGMDDTLSNEVSDLVTPTDVQPNTNRISSVLGDLKDKVQPETEVDLNQAKELTQTASEDNTTSYDFQNEDGKLIKSILKNNIKLHEYFPGEDSNSSSLQQTPTPMWRSTVTLRNTTNENALQDNNTAAAAASIPNQPSNGEAEFQRLLRNLRPTGAKKLVLAEETVPPSSSSAQTASAPALKDVPASSWSVADRIRLAEDSWTRNENKGYSTKINFGSGEATVVQLRADDELKGSTGMSQNPPRSSVYQQSDRPKPIWQRREERKLEAMQKHQDSKLKSTVVHIGLERRGLAPLQVNKFQPDETRSKFNFGSWPPNKDGVKRLPSPRPITNRLPHSLCNGDSMTVHTRLKSTPLVMDAHKSLSTDNDDSSDAEDAETEEEVLVIPSQLAILKEMFRYEDADLSDDSLKADAEVRAYMAGDDIEESCSVVSGSWSRVRAVKNVRQHFRGLSNGTNTRQLRQAHKQGLLDAEPRITVATHAPALEALVSTKQGHPKITSISLRFDSARGSEERNSSLRNTSYSQSKEIELNRRPSPTTVFIQPERRRSASADRSSLEFFRNKKREVTPDRIFSPLRDTFSPDHESKPPPMEEVVLSPVGRKDLRTSSPQRETVNRINRATSPCHISLNQLKPSQKKNFEESSNRGYLFDSDSNRNHRKVDNRSREQETQQPPSSQSEIHQSRIQSTKAEQEMFHKKDRLSLKTNSRGEKSGESNGKSSPVWSTEMYNNKESKREVEKAETESGILEELTRAADEIMKAVNGYTDEDSYRASSEDDEDPRRRRRRGSFKSSAPLCTISETTSTSKKVSATKDCKRACHAKVTAERKPQSRLTKSRVRPTSSNSSLESICRDTKASSSRRGSGASSSEASIKTSSRTARLMQRASSRELLMKSRGSSSEDIPTGELPEKRPQRLVRRTRTHYTTVETPVAQLMRVPREKDKSRDSKESMETRKSRDSVKQRAHARSEKTSRREMEREDYRQEKKDASRSKRTSGSNGLQNSSGSSKHTSHRRTSTERETDETTASRHTNQTFSSRLIGAERAASNGGTPSAYSHNSRRRSGHSSQAHHPRPFK